MEAGTGPRPAPEPSRRSLPWQFAIRGAAVVAGLTLLLVVNVKGAVFYLALGLIALSLVSEASATLVYWRRSRG